MGRNKNCSSKMNATAETFKNIKIIHGNQSILNQDYDFFKIISNETCQSLDSSFITNYDCSPESGILSTNSNSNETEKYGNQSISRNFDSGSGSSKNDKLKKVSSK